MLRKCIILVLLSLCGKTFGGIDVELDVVFSDSIVQCRYLYVLAPVDAEGAGDTLAVFDTLSFNGQNRVSLFYSAKSDGKNMLSFVDSEGTHVESNRFSVSSRSAVFNVIIGQEKIGVTRGSYLYPQKNEDERSYFVFLVIFLAVKILLTFILIFSSKFPKRTIIISTGAYILSAFIEWQFPLHYLYRALLTLLLEYLMVAFVARKALSWIRVAFLILTVNLAGFGIIAFLYLFYVFW